MTQPIYYFTATNVNYRATADEMYEYFSHLGNILEMYMVVNNRNESRGMVILGYDKPIFSSNSYGAACMINGRHVKFSRTKPIDMKDYKQFLKKVGDTVDYKNKQENKPIKPLLKDVILPDSSLLPRKVYIPPSIIEEQNTKQNDARPAILSMTESDETEFSVLRDKGPRASEKDRETDKEKHRRRERERERGRDRHERESREIDRKRKRDSERETNRHERSRERDRTRDGERERERDRIRDRDRDKYSERDRDRYIERERFSDRERDRERERDRDRDRDRERDRERDRDREHEFNRFGRHQEGTVNYGDPLRRGGASYPDFSGAESFLQMGRLFQTSPMNTLQGIPPNFVNLFAGQQYHAGGQINIPFNAAMTDYFRNQRDLLSSRRMVEQGVPPLNRHFDNFAHPALMAPPPPPPPPNVQVIQQKRFNGDEDPRSGHSTLLRAAPETIQPPPPLLPPPGMKLPPIPPPPPRMMIGNNPSFLPPPPPLPPPPGRNRK